MISSFRSRSTDRAKLAAILGGLVAVLGSLAAVSATGSSAGWWVGVLICLAIIVLICAGILIGVSRKKPEK